MIAYAQVAFRNEIIPSFRVDCLCWMVFLTVTLESPCVPYNAVQGFTPHLSRGVLVKQMNNYELQQ